MDRDRFKILLDIIGPELQAERDSVLNLNPITKFCTFLDHLRTNNFHRSAAGSAFAEMSSTCANSVINKIAKIWALKTPVVSNCNQRLKCLF